MSTPSTPSSAGSYTEAEMVARLTLAADASDCFTAKQLSELLSRKGVNGRGKKAQKARATAFAF